ncbi:MAG: FtsX-like permease family protein [Candidatus Thorarchaeota archaeon]
MYLSGRLLSEAPQVLTTLLVFSLASGVLGGILIYLDSAGPFVLSEMTEDMPLHMDVQTTLAFYEQSNMTIEDIESVISEQQGIASTEHITIIDGEYTHLWLAELKRFVYLGVSDTFFDVYADAFEFSGYRQPLQANGCYLEKSLFEAAGINIGDQYNLSVIADTTDWFHRPVYESVPFTVMGVYESHGLWGNYEDKYRDVIVPILRAIVTREDLKEKFNFLDNAPINGVHDRIWVKFEPSALGHNTPSEAVDSLQDIRRRIEQRTVPYAIIGQFPVTSIVESYSTWNTNMMSLAIAFSIPSIVMGVVLVHYTSKLSDDKRRQDVGTLRVRGASTWQTVEWILSVSLITGVVGGVGAVLTGILAAIISGASEGLFEIDFTQTNEFTIFLQPSTLMLVFIFSFSLGLIVSLPPVIKNILMPASDAHKEIERDSNTKEEEMRSPVIDVIVIAFTGILATQLFLMLGGGMIGGSGFLIPVLVIGSFGCFIIFLARFLARFAAPLKTLIMDRISNPKRVVGARIVGRTAKLRIKNETMGVMFIAMVFTAAAFSAVAATTGTHHIYQLSEFNVGSDIVVDLNTFGNNVTTDILEDIRSIDGVQGASGLLEWGCLVHYQTIGPVAIITNHRAVTLYGIQPDLWLDTAFFLPTFTKNLNPTEAFSYLSDDTSNILASFQPIIGYDIAEDRSYTYVYSNLLDVHIYGQPEDVYLNLSIVDVMSVDQDRDTQTFLPGFPDDRDFLVANIDLIHDVLGIPLISKAYVKLEAGVNHTKVIEDIWDIDPDSIVQINSAQDQIDDVIGSKAGNSIYGVYTINVLFSLFYLTIGMSIVAIEKNRGFKKQFSVVRALGSQAESVQSAMLIDAVLTMAMASIIGIFIGSLLSILVLQTPLTYIGVSGSLDWQRLPIALVLPLDIFSLILVLSFSIPLLGTHLITRHSLNQDLADELRAAL